jgi:four helix bundle protein
MHQYKKLKIWQKAMELNLIVYEKSKKFPREERFGLTQQIRRSAVSIPSNIAEGSGHMSEKEFKYFLSIANGSCCELETQIIIANKNNYLESKSYDMIIQIISEIQRMIFGLLEKQRK